MENDLLMLRGYIVAPETFGPLRKGGCLARHRVGTVLTTSVADSAAEEYLSFAFEHCHRSSQKNKRMVLIYLLPVKMLLVGGPSSSLGACPLQEVCRRFTAQPVCGGSQSEPHVRAPPGWRNKPWVWREPLSP